MSFAITSNTTNSNKSNNGAISCKGNTGLIGGIWSGFELSQNVSGTPQMEYAKCSNVSLQNDIYNLKKGSLLDNTCECEIVAETNGEITCPAGKYITTYNSTTKKGICCELCSSDNKVKTSYRPTDCSIAFKEKNIHDVSCPNNTFLKSINVNQNNSKITCCRANLQEGSTQENNLLPKASTEAHNLPLKVSTETNNSPKVSTETNNLPTVSSETNNMNTNKCKEYGLSVCTSEAINLAETKCNQYGMKYYDSTDNKYKNTDSYLGCHIDNFGKLDEMCKQNSVTPCNFYGIRQQSWNDITTIKNDISKIDAIDGIYEQKFNSMGLGGNKMLVIILIILGLIITVLAIYIVVKNK